MTGNAATDVRHVTVDGQYQVWTRKVGHGPIRLLLHGGPCCTHEYFECFEEWLSPDEYTFYYYDQLGSFYSDQPDDTSLWNVERFRGEVEQVQPMRSPPGPFWKGDLTEFLFGLVCPHLRGEQSVTSGPNW
ncbi:hypothetical protein Q0M94_22170 (plasmid) [Deinococcus radiomollis]|uniref:hypothetical protein n=1 Tax=Deinococcus radiomollis TaxID=468916 RepID=UPI0038920B35